MTTLGQATATSPSPASGELPNVPPSRANAATLFSVAAGAIHLALAPEHLGHWWAFGTFFLAVGAFQLAYALAVLWRPTWPVALVGIVANVTIVLIYVASRTVGLPIVPPEPEGADEGHGASGEAAGGFTESVGAVDLATTAAELALIGVLVGLLPDRLRSVTSNVLLLIGVALWGMRFSGLR